MVDIHVFCDCNDCVNRDMIVVRLKEYLNDFDTNILDKNHVMLCDEYGCRDIVREKIQKLLEGEK